MTTTTAAPTKTRTPRKAAAAKAPAAGERALILRSCRADMTSREGRFTWPEAGLVEAPDWMPTANCGNGLHGLLWGEGNGGLMDYGKGVRYVVAEVEAANVVDLGDKVKFPRAWVVFVGDLPGAAAYIAANGGAGRKIVGGTASAGDLGTASAGDRGTASAGGLGTASAGYLGTASAGDRGTASAGYRGTASAGYRGWCAAGKDGALSIQWYDEARERFRVKVGEVGIDGLEPDTLYRIKVTDGIAQFVAVTDAEKAERDAEREAWR